MEESQGIGQGPDDFLGVLLWNFVPGLQLHVGIQRDPSKVLHNQVNVIVGLNNIPDFNNVGVVEHLQNFNFPPEGFLPGHLLDLVLLVNFYGDLLVERLVDGHPH